MKDSNKEFNKTIGIRLKMIRAKLKLTQKEMGEILGLTKVAYSSVERGINKLQINHIDRLAEKLDVNPNFLFSVTNVILLTNEEKKNRLTLKII